MTDDLKTIWADEHDFEEEDPGDGVPEGAPAPAAPEAPKEEQKTPEAPAAPEDAAALEAKQEAEKKAAEEAKLAAEAAAKAKTTQETHVLGADVEGSRAEADVAAALADAPAPTAPAAPAEAPKPALDPKNVLSSAFSSIVEDPAKIEGLTKVVDALGNEKLGADYASIPAPTDEFFKDSKNALLHNLLYIARFELTKKKPSEALAEGETLTSDQNMDKAIALLKEKSETSEIKEDLQKLDLEAVKKALRVPSTTPDAPADAVSQGWFQDFFGKAAAGIAKNMIDNVNKDESGANSWLNMGGMQNQLLLMVLKLCTSLGGKSWYSEMSEGDKTILEKRFGVIKKEDASLFEFGKPTDPDYMKEGETPAAPVETPAAPSEGGQEKIPEIKNKDDALAVFLFEIANKSELYSSLPKDYEGFKSFLADREVHFLTKRLTQGKISEEETGQLRGPAQALVVKHFPQTVLTPYLDSYSLDELFVIYYYSQMPNMDLTPYKGKLPVSEGNAASELAVKKFQEELVQTLETAGNKDLATKVRALDLA